MEKHRIFIGIPIPDKIKKELLNQISFDYHSGFKIVISNNLHITLVFLGQLTSTDIEKLQIKLQDVQLQSFQISITEFNYFPNQQQPKAYAAIISQSSELNILQQRILKICEDLNFSPDTRSYRPHITLARTKPFQETNSSSKPYIPIAFKAEEFHIYQSKSSLYTPIYTFKLSAI